jgi:hypothetical protein
LGQGIVFRDLWIDEKTILERETEIVFVGDLGFAGIANSLREKGLQVIGGNFAENFEISRRDAIDFVKELGILVPDTFVFEGVHYDEARDFIRRARSGVVMKTDWRGDFETTVCDTAEKALEILNKYGDSASPANPIYIQERVEGPELGFDIFLWEKEEHSVWWGFESVYGQAITPLDRGYAPDLVLEAYEKVMTIVGKMPPYWGWVSINFIMSDKGPVFLEFVTRPGYIVSYLHTWAHTHGATSPYDPFEIDSKYFGRWLVGASVFEKDLWGEVVAPIELGPEFLVSWDTGADFYTHVEMTNELMYLRIPMIPRVGVRIWMSDDLEDKRLWNSLSDGSGITSGSVMIDALRWDILLNAKEIGVK